MKLLLFIPALCLVVSNSAYANIDIEKYCFSATQLARVIMTSRQSGVPIERALALRDAVFDDHKDESLRQVHTEIILEAYEVPMYSTEAYKQSEIDEFAAFNYVTCIQSMRLAKQHGKLD